MHDSHIHIKTALHYTTHTYITGNPYYYNNKTGESRWESPEWVEETDQSSGAR